MEVMCEGMCVEVGYVEVKGVEVICKVVCGGDVWRDVCGGRMCGGAV